MNHYDLEWPEFDGSNQSYMSLGIPPKIGHHYRQKMMDFWNNRLPDLLKNLPPNESASRVDRPEILPPEDPPPKKPPYYDPMRKPEPPWYRLPPIPPTQSTSIYGTIVTSGVDKSRSTSTVLLGVDGRFGSRLPAGNPVPPEPSPEVETGSSSSMAMSIVIVIGVCLLLVNLCAFAGLYYQRDKLRVQERMMKKRYEDVEPTNNEEPYMSQKREEDEGKNITALEMSVKKDTLKKKKAQQSGDEIYEAVRSRGRTMEVREDGLEEDDCGESGFKRWRLSRQCSASTMDPHTKVREWIAHEIVQRCSPRFLRRTKFQLQHQPSRPILQKDSSFDTSIDQLSSAVMTLPENREPNPSSPALSKPTTTTTLQRSRVKKVSVAVDATPAARSASVLKQIPIEQMSKSMEELGADRCISTSEITLEQKKAALKRSETCRESLARSSCSPVPEHSPQRDTVLRRSTTSINLKVCPSILKKTTTGLPISHGHSKSDPVPHTAHFMPQGTPQPSISQNMCPHIYNISLDSKGGTQTSKEGMSSTQMKTFPTPNTHVQLKPNAPKKDIGVTASPVSKRLEDINVTSRDSTLIIDKSKAVDPLKNIQRRNFPKVLPDLPYGQDMLMQQDTDEPDREFTPVQTIAAKRRSLPPPTHLLVGLHPPKDDTGSTSQPTTPTGGYHKDIQALAGKVPPLPPPRVSSTLGRKPCNTNPVTPLEATQESTKLKSPVLTSSTIYHQRPEPRVIIKPTSTTPVTRNPSVTQSRNKQIPRVVPNTGEDYPLTPTALHQTSSPGASQGPSLSRQSSLRSQGPKSTPQPQVHKTSQRTGVSTATPPLQTKASHQQKLPAKKSIETSTTSLFPSEDTSSNTGTVKRVKKGNDGKNQTTGTSSVSKSSVNKGSTVPKAWYAQYNQSFLSKTKDSDN